MKESKGITLVALIITIVLLLILAGIGISSINNDNGIIRNAEEAKRRKIESEYEELINIAIINAEKHEGESDKIEFIKNYLNDEKIITEMQENGGQIYEEENLEEDTRKLVIQSEYGTIWEIDEYGNIEKVLYNDF